MKKIEVQLRSENIEEVFRRFVIAKINDCDIEQKKKRVKDCDLEYIEIPIYSNDKDENGVYNQIGTRKEFI